MFELTEEIRNTCIRTGERTRQARKNGDESTARFQREWFARYRDFESSRYSGGDKTKRSEVFNAMETLFSEGYTNS